MVQSALPHYYEFGPAGYAKLGYSDRLLSYQSGWDPECDFGFFGLVTPYRREILSKIAGRFSVQTAKSILHPGELPGFIAKCRVGLSFKQSPKWPIPSPTRLGRLMHMRRNIACESVADPTPQGRFVPICPADQDFADFCMHRLSNWKTEAAESLEQYRTQMPMKLVMEQLLDETIGASGATGSASADDVRSRHAELTYVYPDETPVLISVYLGWNIVRIGAIVIAVAQDQGPLDLKEILVGRAVTPPKDKFLLGHSEGEAQAAIDALRSAAVQPN